MQCRRQSTNEKGVEVVDTSVHTLKLHELLHKESASAKGPVN